MPYSCKTPDDVLQIIRDDKVEMIDLRFTDLPGLWQHFSVPPSALELGTEIGGIANPRALKKAFGLLRDVPRIATVGLGGDRIHDIADENQGRCLRKRVKERGGRIRHGEHVALLDLLEAAN